MRKLLTLVVVLFAAACSQSVNVEQEKAALLAVDGEWSKAAQDLDKFVSYFAPNATFAPAGAPAIVGVANIREAVGSMMKTPGFSLSWKATRADVSASGDLGYTAGTYAMTANNAAGIAATENGKYLTTWKKIDGAWKVVEDTVNSDAPIAVSSAHIVATPADITWGEPPPIIEPGAKFAVISDDPSQPVPFTIRLQLPSGYRFAPHSHPTDEHVTVLSGTLAAAMGETFDEAALKDLPAGSYVVMSATMPHYALARTATTLQVHGMGPFTFTYVNPADDPSKK